MEIQCGASPFGCCGLHTRREHRSLLSCQREVTRRAQRQFFAGTRGFFELGLHPGKEIPEFSTWWLPSCKCPHTLCALGGPSVIACGSGCLRRRLRFHDPASTAMELHTLMRGRLIQQNGGWAHHEKGFLTLANVGRGSLYWSSIVHRRHSITFSAPSPFTSRHGHAIAFVELKRIFAKLHSFAPLWSVDTDIVSSRSQSPQCFRDFIRGIADRVCNRQCIFSSRSLAAVTMLRWGTPPFLKVPLPFMIDDCNMQKGTLGAVHICPPPWLLEQEIRWSKTLSQCGVFDNATVPCGFQDTPGGCIGFSLGGNMPRASTRGQSLCPCVHHDSDATGIARVHYGLHGQACRVCHGYVSAKCRSCTVRFLFLFVFAGLPVTRFLCLKAVVFQMLSRLRHTAADSVNK